MKKRSPRERRGWSIEKALTTPPQQMYTIFEINGIGHTLSEWIKICGLEDKTNNINNRVYHCGWDAEKALTTPIETPKIYSFNGENHTLKEMAF